MHYFFRIRRVMKKLFLIKKYLYGYGHDAFFETAAAAGTVAVSGPASRPASKRSHSGVATHAEAHGRRGGVVRGGDALF